MKMNMKKMLLTVGSLAVCAASAAVPYRFGAAGRTFHRNSLDETLDVLRNADVRYFCVRDFCLPYDSDDAAVAAFKAKCAAAGVVPYALGPLNTKDVSQLRPYFEFASGRDPVKTIHEYGDRIFDVHVKNLEVGKPDGAAITLSRGSIDYVKVFSALAEIGYDGVCAFDYEMDYADNVALVFESVGYARGVADAIRIKPRMKPVPVGANAPTAQENGVRVL